VPPPSPPPALHSGLEELVPGVTPNTTHSNLPPPLFGSPVTFLLFPETPARPAPKPFPPGPSLIIGGHRAYPLGGPFLRGRHWLRGREDASGGGKEPTPRDPSDAPRRRSLPPSAEFRPCLSSPSSVGPSVCPSVGALPVSQS